MKNICVFCGSAKGQGDSFIELAKNLGQEIHNRGYGLVYGGASIGVMGAMADQILEMKGSVIGVMPKSLVNWEVEHKGLTKFEMVDTMHERKQKMYDYSDAFLAIPGGMGTLDELFEILTWAQLQYHKKPIYLLNFNGFYDHLIKHIESASDAGFIKPHHVKLINVITNVDQFFHELKL